ncbi:MAG: RagB/SusD family nutrient uptake outer membrane protein [Saprospiraceae bacterium]|nr:RagB/SusD family nutrient uptake outer membrane protein [Saprospiraceae bacterium]
MKQTFKIYALIIGLMIFNQGCVKDLDTSPLDNDLVTSGNVYENEDTYKQVLAKLYAGLAVSGQEGPAGNSDIGGIDEGFGQYLRGLWYHAELPTDEAVIGWNDQTIADFHDLDWTESDSFIAAFYSRIFYQISLCNEFIRQTEPDVLDEREVSQATRDEIVDFRAEARFLRALSYWHALDHFRNVPFVTELDAVGATLPMQTNAQDLFNYIEAELLAIESEIKDARSNEYGRADKGAVWMLLAKLYLNAEVYVSSPRYGDCLTYCEKLIGAGYSLEAEYPHLFLADNHNSNEIIFPVTFDGINTRTWGGMTFIIRAGIGGGIDPAESGVVSGWGGTRITKQVVDNFGDIGGVLVEYQPKSNLPQVYLGGDFQGNTIDTDWAVNSINSDKIYEGFQYFEAGNSFVIAPNPTLSFVYGDNGADGSLEIAGDPIIVNEEGLYYIKIDMNTPNRSVELIKVDLVASGSAVGSDVPMTWDPATRIASAPMTLSAGDLSFKAVGSDLVLGDSDGDGYLTFAENPINIDYSEPVEIFLNISKQAFTYQIASTSFDRRGIFNSDGQNLDIDNISEFNEGYAVTKFKNIASDGTPGSDTDFPDTDFPMFRLADAYLMGAEAILRSGGDLGTATDYVNALRERAYKGSGGNISTSDLDLNFIIEERARELYWECHRRTDLVRFNLLTTSDYLWDWKGGIQEGKAVEDFRNVFPIPASDINANPNLTQNTGY